MLVAPAVEPGQRRAGRERLPEQALVPVSAKDVDQVPGGLGVLEASILYLLARLAPGVPVPRIVAALLAFRGIYYFAPLIVASLMLGGYEARLRHRQVLRVARGIGSRGEPDSIMPAMIRHLAHPLVAGLLLAAPFAPWLTIFEVDGPLV